MNLNYFNVKTSKISLLIALFCIGIFMPHQPFSQEIRTITGNMFSEDEDNGMLLPDVNIVIEGTNYASVTDFSFSTNSKLQKTLSFAGATGNPRR